jgi:hypothetical protein
VNSLEQRYCGHAVTGIAACKSQVLMGESANLLNRFRKEWNHAPIDISLLDCIAAGNSLRRTDGRVEEWKRYKNTDGNFTVLFPGEPKDSTNEIPGGMTSHTLQIVKTPAVYTLVWTFIDAKQTVTDANFEVFKTSFLSKLPKCTVAADQPASPALLDLPQGKVTIVGSLYWGKHYSYAVMGIFSATVPQPTDVKKFVESIMLIDPGK